MLRMVQLQRHGRSTLFGPRELHFVRPKIEFFNYCVSQRIDI